MTSVQTPVIAPAKAPDAAPIRRLHPDEICPSQKERVVRTITKDV